MTILNWNANGVIARGEFKIFELAELLHEHSVDVACITETLLQSTLKLYISDYTVHRWDQPDSKFSGVTTIVGNALIHTGRNLTIPSLEVCSIETTLNSSSIQLTMCYYPPLPPVQC